MIVLGSLPMLAVFGVVVVAPPGPDAECPSARQVWEAMQARLGAALVIAPNDPQANKRADALHASLDVAGDGTVVRFALVDARGETQLRRTLPSPGRGQAAADCVALADILGSIVERYLDSLNYDSPDVEPVGPTTGPPSPMLGSVTVLPAGPPPGPRGGLALLGLGWRMDSGGPPGSQSSSTVLEARVGAQLDIIRSTPRLAAVVTAGASQPTDFSTPNSMMEQRTGTVWRFPFRVGALLELPAGVGWVEPSLLAGVDILSISSPAMNGAPKVGWTQWPLAADVAVGYRLKIAGRLHLRPHVAIGFAMAKYDIDLPDKTRIYQTGRPYASFGIDTAVVFR